MTDVSFIFTITIPPYRSTDFPSLQHEHHNYGAARVNYHHSFWWKSLLQRLERTVALCAGRAGRYCPNGTIKLNGSGLTRKISHRHD